VSNALTVESVFLSEHARDAKHTINEIET